MVDFRMPSLGADMEAGTLVEWLVKPGDRVKRGDVVAVVETQKGAIEIEIFETGRIEQILVDLGTKVPVGTPLARIRTELEDKAGVAAARATCAPPSASAMPVPSAVHRAARRPVTPAAAPIVSGAGLRARASPAARRLAQTHRVDLATVTGSGPGGAIVRADVERHLAAPALPAEKKRPAGLDLDAMRTAIAAAMARSKREIPHYYLAASGRRDAVRAWLARTNADAGAGRTGCCWRRSRSRPSAWRRAASPRSTASIAMGATSAHPAVHVGVAIAIRGGGLAAPAMHDADQMPLDELMARMRDLVQRTRAGRIRSSEMSDPTITVSSLGERGVEALYGVIYPPQVAIVGFGKLVSRPWVVDAAPSDRARSSPSRSRPTTG